MGEPGWSFGAWLTREQYESLVDDPDKLAQHSNDVITKLMEKLATLDASHATDLLAAQQAHHELESRNRLIVEELNKKVEKLQHIEQMYRQRDEDAEQANAREVALAEERDTLLTQVRKFESEARSAKDTTREQVSALEAKQTQVDALNARIKSESEKYHNASREAAELRQQLNESEARKSDLQFRLTQAETLKAEIESTNTWMQRQLEEKSKQLVDLRSEKSTDVFKLQQQLDSTESELRSVQRLHQTVQAQLQERDVEVDRLSVELTNVKQDKASAEASLESKVESLIRVRDLYKDQVQELQDKIAGTSQSHESHRLVLQQLQEQHMQDLEERDEATRKALKDVDTLAKRVADLQQQLDTASSSQGAIMNEEAMIQHIQKLVADPSGRKNVATIIQLQKNLEQTTMQLEQERNEKARLQVMLERIGEEISTREPQIVQKEKEFARMVKEHQEMSRRLQVAVERSEQESAQLIAVQRQLASAEKRAETLTSQLATLVWDVEQLHGNNSDPAPAGTSEFTFHRVQELVQMNQQLLKVVEETTGGTAGENDAMLDTALEQLKKLMAERERQEEKIRQQNNMIEVYRTQLVESEERRHQLERQGRSNAKRSDAGEVSTQHHQQVDVLAQQSHFDSATLRLEEVRRELDVKNAELKSAADSVNLLKAQLASKEAAFDAETRRSQALNQSTQLLQAQLTDMKERHMGLTKQFSEMEVVLTSAVRENALSKDQVALKEHELLKLRAQSQFLNETVQRYTQDLATVRTECDRFSRFHQDLQLMLSERSSELQSVKSNAEQESKRLQTEVESLKQEVHSLREQIKIEESQLSLTRSEARQDAEVYKAKFARLQEENAAKTAAHDASLLELGAANVQIAKLNERITELSTILQQQEEALRVEQDAGAQESAMRKLQAENRKLQATLKSSELALATLKEVTASRASVNDQIETELQRVSQELETSQNRARQEIDERDEEIQRLNTEVTQALQTNDELRAQLSAVQQRLDSIDSVHARELEEAQSATAAAIAEKEGAVETMKIAQDEARIATDSQTELRRTYEIGVRELSESFNVQARLRQEMDELKQRYQEEHSQLLAANSQLQQLKEEQSTAIASSQAERQEMQRRIDEGTQRVKSLLEQLETVNSHLNQLRLSRLVPSTDASALPASGDETVRSLSDTLQYLRRENEIISTELSIAKKDCERLRVQAELFRQNADAARAQLDEEKANRDRLVQSQQEYNDHLQRLEQFNTLRESNACLRSDLETTNRALTEERAKSAKLEAELAPLQQKIAELSTDRGTLEGQIKTLTTQIGQWKLRAQAAAQKDNAGNAELVKARSEADELKSQNAELKQTVSQLEARVSDASAQINQLKSKVTDSDERAARAEQQALEYEQENEVLSSQLEEMRAAPPQTGAASLTPTSAPAASETAAENPEALRKEYEKIEALKVQLKKIQQNLKEKSVKLKEEIAAFESKKSEVSALQASYDQLAATHAKCAAIIAEKEALINEKDGAIVKLKALLQRLKNAHQGAAASATNTTTPVPSANIPHRNESAAVETAAAVSKSMEEQLRSRLLAKEPVPTQVVEPAQAPPATAPAPVAPTSTPPKAPPKLGRKINQGNTNNPPAGAAKNPPGASPKINRPAKLAAAAKHQTPPEATPSAVAATATATTISTTADNGASGLLSDTKKAARARKFQAITPSSASDQPVVSSNEPATKKSKVVEDQSS